MRRPAPRSAGPRADPEPSARYTPAQPEFRIRPVGHKAVGGVLVGVGAVVALLNDIQWVSARVQILPGGHSELYLMLAIAVAGFGAWWLGLFDRPSSR